MLQKRNIVCIANPLWEGDYAKTIVELMSVFARGNKVLYVENAYTYKDMVKGIFDNIKFPFNRVWSNRNRVRELILDDGVSVFVLTPPLVLPINFLPPGHIYNGLLTINGKIVTSAIKKALKKLQMLDNLVNIVSFNPAIGVKAGRKLDEKLLLYHCYDTIEAADWIKKHGAYLEEQMMKMADGVIVTSQGLYNKKKSLTRECFLVKNAVNIKLFSKGFNLEIHNQKIIGYIGSIDDRLDYELLEFLFQKMHNYTFIFVGRIVDKTGERILRKYENVHLEGNQHVNILPTYLNKFAVGIIPFLTNEFNKGIYPLKINEYLAAGLPIVSSDFSDLSEFKSIIRISSSKQKFLEMILEELDSDTPEKKNKRLEIAKSNSWEQRVNEISDIIEKLEKVSFI
jgi:glycosyltransferase involved in cell wall biosynthesis